MSAIRTKFIFGVVAVVLAAVALFGGTAAAVIGYGGSVGTATAKTAGTALAFASSAAVPTGRSIVVSFAMDDAAGAVSVTDAVGNTYSVDADVRSAGVRTVILSAHDVRTLPAGSLIAVTHPSVVASALSVAQFSGLEPTATLDRTKTATGTGTAASSGAAAVTTQANELLVGAIGVEGPTTEGFTRGAGFTALTRAGTTGGIGSTNMTINPEYRIVSATGAYTATGTLSASRNWGVALATYKMDVTGPPVTLTSPATGVSLSDTTPTFSGAAGVAGSDSATVTLKIYRGPDTTGVLEQTRTATRVGSAWTVDALPSLVDGTYTARAEQTETNGNTGFSAPRTFTVDTTPPGPPTIAPDPPSPGNDTTPTWTLSAPPGASLECELRRGATVLDPLSACAGSYVADLTAEADGTYTLAVQAVDVAGNRSSMVTDNYVLDTAAPAAPGITSSPASPDRDSTPTWSFTGEPGAGFECRLMQGATVIQGYGACSGSKTYNLLGEFDGTYTFSVRQTDVAGNLSAEAGDDYTFDTQAPLAPVITTAPSSPSNDLTQSWDFNVEPGATLACRLLDGAIVVDPFSACNSGSYGFDFSGSGDATYTFEVRATDLAGNLSESALDEFTLDTQAPPVPTITSEPQSPSNDNTPTWTFSSDPGSSFECELRRAATVIEAFSGCDAAIKSYDLGSEIDGTYTFEVRAVDAAGNASVSISEEYELDTTAPSIPSSPDLLAGSDTGSSNTDDVTSDATPTLNGTAEAGVTVKLHEANNEIAFGVAAGGSYSITSPALSDGGYGMRVLAVDAAGNQSELSDVTVVTIDSQAPAAPVITTVPPSPSNDATPTWDFSGESGATLECRLLRGATVVDPLSACDSGSYSFDHSGSGDATYTFEVRSTDLAGNSSGSASDDFTFDSQAPPGPTLTSVPQSPSNDSTPTWTFTEDPESSFECELKRGATVVDAFSDCDSGTKTYDLGSQPDDTYTFEVRARDAAGNLSEPTPEEYTYDTTAPPLPEITMAPQSPGSDRTPTWAFSGEGGAAFECELEREGAVVEAFIACDSGTKSYDLTTSSDGAYVFRVRQIDVAGNVGAAESAGYEFDTAPPAAPSAPDLSSADDTGSSNTDNITSDATPTLTGSADPGSSVKLWRSATQVGSATADAGGTYSVISSSLEDGGITLRVSATDVAGNESAASNDLAMIVDTGSPASPSISSQPSSPSNDRTPTWEFAGESGASLECRLLQGGVVVEIYSLCDSGSYTPDLASRIDETYVFEIRSEDIAGNLSPIASDAYVLETGAPPVPAIPDLVASSDTGWSTTDNYTRDTTPTVSGTTEDGATVTLIVNGVQKASATASGGTYSLTSTVLPRGARSLQVKAADSLGNESALSPPLSMRIDNKKAAISSIRTRPNPFTPSAKSRYAQIDFRVNEGARVQVTISRSGKVTRRLKNLTLAKAGTVLVKWDGRNARKKPVSPGKYRVVIRAVDKAGNVTLNQTRSITVKR